jgi:hypothetical protein
VALIVETVSWWLKEPLHAYSADQIAAILHRVVTSSVLTP